MEENSAELSVNDEQPGKKKWWELPFDTTSNFSLLGFLFGGSYWEGNGEKSIGMNLDE